MTTVGESWRLSAAEIARRVAGGELAAADVVADHLARVAAVDPELNAFSAVLAYQARTEAAERDRALADGTAPGPLAGVPVVVKEELDVAGLVTTFGGRGNSSPAAADSEVVRRVRAAGGVVLGKSTMPEFGAFPYTESDAYGVTRNPWSPEHTPGGSSGGTAAAVATGMAAVGLGGDGGGSIRIPAAACGLFGLKPQRGRVTAAPLAHLWFALGTTGPLSRTVLDSAVVYDTIRGSMPGDRFHAGETGAFVAAAAAADPGRLRIGWSARPVSIGIRPDPLHVAVLEETARELAALGHDVREVDPGYPDPTAVFLPQFFGGIRAEAEAMEHPERLERRTRQTVRLGGWVSDDLVERAVTACEGVAAKANRVFDDVDVLMTPTIAHRPPRVGVLTGTGTVRAILRAMPAVTYTALWNVAGNPAASVPRETGPDGLPTAVQLVGRPDAETTLLALAAQLEAASPWPLLTDR